MRQCRGFLSAIVLVAIILSLLTPASALAAGPASPTMPSILSSATQHEAAVARALAYLKGKQLDGGGFEGYTPGSPDEFATIKATIALAASGRPASYLTKGGATPLSYLASRAVAYTHQSGHTTPDYLFPGRAGMLAVGVVAADSDPTAFGSPAPMDLIAELEATYDPATGEYSTSASDGFASGAASAVNQTWAILGHAADERPMPSKASDYLIGFQEADGGWGYGFGGDVDLTGLAIQALVASGNTPPDDQRIQDGLAFLRSQQVSSGGWGYSGDVNADSTAAAIQGIVAAGYTPATASWTSSTGRDPHDELDSLQASDGSFTDNPLGTAHAIPGLTETPLPVLGRQQRARLALTWIGELQNADGSWSSAFGAVGATCDAALAYAAAGYDPDQIKTGPASTSALQYLKSSASTFAVGTSPDNAGKLTVTAVAAGSSPSSFGGINLADSILSYYGATTPGAFGDAGNTWHQAFAIIGLKAAGQSIPGDAVVTLRSLQQPDGGWKYSLTPDESWNTTAVDSTGLALQALVASGVPSTDPSVVNARSFLRSKQDDDGGWTDANSTAFAIQGLLAIHDDLVADWSVDGHSPFDALSSYQKRDGPFVWMWSSDWSPAEDNFLAAAQAVPALVGVSYPLSTTPGALVTFTPAVRGPDPDRLVTVSPSASRSTSAIQVVAPFGSDLNSSGSVSLSYRLDGGSWQSLTSTRGDGRVDATIPGAKSGQYEIRAVFTDPDGVQGSSERTTVYTLPLWKELLPLAVHGVN